MILISNKLGFKRKKGDRLNNPFTAGIVKIKFRLNQFIKLKLLDFGDGIETTLVCVNGRSFNVSMFSLEEAHEILHDTNTYCCMDEAHRNLIRRVNCSCSNVDSNTMFWIYCYYIKAWIDRDYDTRLLQMDDVFPILNALYEAGDTKARNNLKFEIKKRFLSGYIPVIKYLISMGYLKFFEFEEIIWLFEKCLEIAGFHNFSALKTQIFCFLRDQGFNYFYSDNFKKSIKYLKDALKICPFDVQTLKQLGVVYLKNGDYELARTFLVYVLDLPSSDDIFTKNYLVEAWRNLGELNNRLLLFSKATIACKMAMDLDRGHVNTWDQIAIAYDGLGDFKRAKEANKSFKKNEKKIKKVLRKEGAQW